MTLDVATCNGDVAWKGRVTRVDEKDRDDDSEVDGIMEEEGGEEADDESDDEYPSSCPSYLSPSLFSLLE